MVERTIDLSPARLGEIQRRGDTVVLVFPSQACYTDATGESPRLVPLFRCEMHFEAGVIQAAPGALPLETDDWELAFRGGSRASMLPASFEADGPVVLRFGQAVTASAIVTGRRVAFSTKEQVGTEEQWPAT